MLTGPIPATRKILERNGMTIDDIDLIEINEAFASVVAAWERELEPDIDKVNVERRRDRARPSARLDRRAPADDAPARARAHATSELGLVTMCCGGGLGTATLIERL